MGLTWYIKYLDQTHNKSLTMNLTQFTLILGLSEMLRASSDCCPVSSDSTMPWLVHGITPVVIMCPWAF